MHALCMVHLTPIQHKVARERERDSKKAEEGTEQNSCKSHKKKDDTPAGLSSVDVVATNKALQVAAGWLGMNADDVMGGLATVDDNNGHGDEHDTPGLFTGLGFQNKKKASFKSKSSINSAWNKKVDDRLLQNRKKAQKVRRREETDNDGQDNDDSEDGEGSRAAAVGTRHNTGISKMHMLTAKKKKKRK